MKIQITWPDKHSSSPWCFALGLPKADIRNRPLRVREGEFAGDLQSCGGRRPTVEMYMH